MHVGAEDRSAKRMGPGHTKTAMFSPPLPLHFPYILSLVFLELLLVRGSIETLIIMAHPQNDFEVQVTADEPDEQVMSAFFAVATRCRLYSNLTYSKMTATQILKV